jgi:polysaccharide chain length determinant protein (PEP-CTERM system associated)
LDPPANPPELNFELARKAGGTGAEIMENRELSMDDYLAMLRRRMKVILIPALLAPLAGFLVSYAFPAKFTSQALVLVEGQKVPEGIVQPVVTADLAQRIATLQQQVLSDSSLRPMLDRSGLVKPNQNADDVMDSIRMSMSVEPVITDMAQFGTTKKRPGGGGGEVPGFYVNYTASSAREAQQICNELTSLLLEENLKSRENVARGTTDFLSKQVDDTKHSLDDLDSKLAAFKKQYMGQLPGDADNNLKILMGLNSQLEANTQTLSRAQQDKAYTESLLAQQVSAWKSSGSSNNPQSLNQQLTQLQAQLIDLEARYTADHPDVIKTKADIAQVQKKLDEVNNAVAKPASGTPDKESASEPGEIRQLRMQVHQYEDLIGQATRDQKRLQQEISVYQGRVALSPAIEEQYKQLARDYDNTQKVYQDLLANKSKSDMALKMEQQQQGEQMHLLNPANLPDAPSFPNRLLFAGGGLGAGLVLGVGLALWLELRDKSIRTQADAEAALDLPMLVAVPWVAETVAENGNGKGRFWNKNKQPEETETAKF